MDQERQDGAAEAGLPVRLRLRRELSRTFTTKPEPVEGAGCWMLDACPEPCPEQRRRTVEGLDTG